MVYHEVRNIDGKKLNYLIYNERVNGKWKKKSKFIGKGIISKDKIKQLKEDFEKELKLKSSKYLNQKQILEIEILNERYKKGIKKLSKEEFAKFEKSFFTELTYNSNAIEGNSMSLQETSIVVNENLAPEGKSLREIHEAKNHAKAIEFIKNYKGDVNEQLILKVHSIILKDILGRFTGRYRENPVRVVGSDFKFPSYNKVAQLIKNLIYWYKKNKKLMHPFELAVVFSMKLVTIHPFVDGNGRISRLLMNVILEKNKYPWINIYLKQRQKYLNAVRKANDEDYSEILDLMIKTLKENLDSFEFN